MANTLRDQLFRAIEKSDIKMLRAVLKQGVSLSYEPGDHMPVFYLAVDCGRDDTEILDALLAHGADIHTIWNTNYGTGGYGPLHWVVGTQREEVVRWFLKHGADINAVDNTGLTPFNARVRIFAQWQEDDDEESFLSDECKILLEAGVDLKLADKEGNTPLHYAALNNLPKIAQFLLENGCPIDVKNIEEKTPLHMAVKGGSSEIVEFLLKQGADPNDKAKGEAPLHELAGLSREQFDSTDLNIAELLIKAGAKVDATDIARTDVPQNMQFTALVEAASNDNLQMVQFLSSKGAALDFMNGLALRQATYFEYDDIVEHLLSLGAKPDLRDSESLDGALHIAASERYLSGVKLLLEHKANIELCNIDGETALCVAVRRWADDVARHLVEKGANVNHIDAYGNTPLFWAKRKGNTEIAEVLIKAGARA